MATQRANQQETAQPSLAMQTSCTIVIADRSRPWKPPVRLLLPTVQGHANLLYDCYCRPFKAMQTSCTIVIADCSRPCKPPVRLLLPTVQGHANLLYDCYCRPFKAMQTSCTIVIADRSRPCKPPVRLLLPTVQGHGTPGPVALCLLLSNLMKFCFAITTEWSK